MPDDSLSESVKAQAQALGFALCGITDASPPPHHRQYVHWVAEGRAGEMLYLHRQEPKRGDLQQVLPGARSVVCVALNYAAAEEPLSGHGTPSVAASRATSSPRCSTGYPEGRGPASRSPETGEGGVTECWPSDPPRFGEGEALALERGSSPGSLTGTVARYARFDDYHETLWERLEALLAFIQASRPEARGKVYCDTGPITERDLAMRAGLGWIGKHTNLISRRLGNWFFLGEILLDIPLTPDVPETTHCGTCTRCLPACPTGAIVAPYHLDARRCISYLTIELKGSIPIELRPLIGTRIYGCDDCLAVCPWNKFARAATDETVHPRTDLLAPDLLDLLALDDEGFRGRFRHSPIRRAKRRGLLRNVCVALGNLGDPRALPALHRAGQSDPEPLVREHATWAIAEIVNKIAGEHWSQVQSTR